MKSELRKQVLQEIKAVPQKQKIAMDRALTKRFLNHSFFNNYFLNTNSYAKSISLNEIITVSYPNGLKSSFTALATFSQTSTGR